MMQALQLLGALGMFLYGMNLMSSGLQKASGSKLRNLLSAMTSNPFKGVVTGLGITSIIQSSSATTVMTVGFVNAGLLTLTQAIGVIMGANIGTTVTAWMVSLLGFKADIAILAVPLMGLGFILSLSKRDKRRYISELIVGFSLLFLGLSLMKESVPNLNENPQVLAFIQEWTSYKFGSVLIFLALGSILTLVLQSSSATMALTLIMVNMGWIPFEMGAAMVLGENIGTTITANIAASVGNINARRAALAHTLFNVFGVCWALILFKPFLAFVGTTITWLGLPDPTKLNLTPVVDKAENSIEQVASTTTEQQSDVVAYDEELIAANAQTEVGTDQTTIAQTTTVEDGAEGDAKITEKTTVVTENSTTTESTKATNSKTQTPEQLSLLYGISMLHSMFNIINTLILVWFTSLIAKIVTFIIRDRKKHKEEDELEDTAKLKFIDGGHLSTAEFSIGQARNEIIHFAEISRNGLGYMRQMIKATDENTFEKMRLKMVKYEEISDRIEYEIATFLNAMPEDSISDSTRADSKRMYKIIGELESLGDSGEAISRILARRNTHQQKFTDEQIKRIESMIDALERAYDVMIENLKADTLDPMGLRKATDCEIEINTMRNNIREEEIYKIERNEVTYHSSVYYIDVVSEIERMGDFVINISQALE